MPRRALRVLQLVPIMLLVAAAFGNHARAQAWVPPKGSVTGDIDYNLGISSEVVETQGMVAPDAGVTTNQMTVHAEYVPIEHLAVEIGIPMILIQYTGSKTLYPHPGGGTYDDGSSHFTLTDFSARARYQLLANPFALTPHIGVTAPMENYETVGNAVGGRHITGLHLGLAIGKIFLNTFYTQLTYDFMLGSKYSRTADTDKYNQDVSEFTFTIGDKLLDGKLDINLGANFHMNHDGVNFVDFGTLPADVVLYHDPVLAEQMFLIGGGIGYLVTPSIDIAAAVRIFISGANTQNANVYGLSLTWFVR